MKTYRFHWRDGSTSDGEGKSPDDAFDRLGFSPEDARSLESCEQLPEIIRDSEAAIEHAEPDALELPRRKVWRDGNGEYRLVLDASGFEGILIVQRKLRTADGHKWQYDGSRTTFELLCIGAMLSARDARI
jgi:hypothetical protein